MSVRLVKSEGQTAQAWAAATDAMAEEYGDREKAEQNVEFLKALADLDANEQDYMFWALNILAGRRPNDIAKKQSEN